MSNKLIARLAGTETYFNGTNFSATKSEALELRPGTTADDFQLMWAAPVEVVEDAPKYDAYNAAKDFVRKCQRDFNQKSFCIRLCEGKYISRTVQMPKRHGEAAFIKLHGTEVAVRMSGGELAVG